MNHEWRSEPNCQVYAGTVKLKPLPSMGSCHVSQILFWGTHWHNSCCEVKMTSAWCMLCWRGTRTRAQGSIRLYIKEHGEEFNLYTLALHYGFCRPTMNTSKIIVIIIMYCISIARVLGRGRGDDGVHPTHTPLLLES